MSNSYGKLFRITTFGESHGAAVGVIVDGCPAGLEISVEEIQAALDRRRPGQSDITTPRKEEDKVTLLSGIFEGRTTGTPIAMVVGTKIRQATTTRMWRRLSVPRMPTIPTPPNTVRGITGAADAVLHERP